MKNDDPSQGGPTAFDRRMMTAQYQCDFMGTARAPYGIPCDSCAVAARHILGDYSLRKIFYNR